MKLNRLKPLRVCVSLIFFSLIALLFLDFRSIFPLPLADGVLYLQFVPSLLKFVNLATLGAAGFIAVLVLTLLFGRVYCSTICPLGTFQDVVSRLANRKKSRRKFKRSKPHNVLRYSILGLTALLFMAGAGLLLNLLDPFSSFGRIFANLFRPLVMAANNGAAALLEGLGIHALYRVPLQVVAPVSVGVSLGLLALVAVLAAKHGRLYCNTVCPVGALLGLVSRISLLKLSVDHDACMGCKLCEGVCKAGCIDIRQEAVDYSRCVGCYNCLAVCPSNGLRFENKWRKPSTPATEPDAERREFMLDSGMYLVGLAGVTAQGKKLIQAKPTKIPTLLTSPVSPPGSMSIEHFTSTCTACHLCVSACPSHVLAPSFLEFGFLGMMQPRLDFKAGHCNYDCTICTDICPSGALLPLSKEQKKRTQLGVAKFIKENCVVHTDHTNCGACSEHCPTKAVDMVPYPNKSGKKLVIPKVNPEICVGCGGCEQACPTKPYKAIYVDGNPVHKQAKKPAVKKLNKKIDYKKEFPF